jgi:hypothetical protein
MRITSIKRILTVTSTTVLVAVCICQLAFAAALLSPLFRPIKNLLSTNQRGFVVGPGASDCTIPTRETQLVGIVRTANGKPVAGAKVTLSRELYVMGSPSCANLAPLELGTTTDKIGQFVFSKMRLPVWGKWKVEVRGSICPVYSTDANIWFMVPKPDGSTDYLLILDCPSTF